MRYRIPATLLLLALSGSLPAVEEAATPVEVSKPELSAEDRARAQEWGLGESEWHRYQALMQGVRGSLSVPTISPIEVLGIHAENEEERSRYAERFVELMREDTERILAFERAYHAAWRRLYPEMPLIDRSLLGGGGSSAPAQSPIPALQGGDRLLYFAKSGCEPCDAALAPLLARVRDAQGWGLDIYLLNTGAEDARVRAWAKERAIPPELVASRQVTLNHDGGTLAKLAGKDAALPQILHRRGEAFTVMDLRP
jgi:integrating conjugative element protein (TIGR03759 family)